MVGFERWKVKRAGKSERGGKWEKGPEKIGWEDTMKNCFKR